MKNLMHTYYDVLIVDDDPNIRNSIKVLLSQCEGFRNIVEAKNSVEAVNKISNQNFVLILCDINMPGKDGFSLIEHVSRKQGGFKDNIVFISGDSGAENVKRAISLGVKNFIVKPIDINLFLEKIYMTTLDFNQKVATSIYKAMNFYKESA